MKTLVESEPEFLKTLADFLEKVHSPHLVDKELGLTDHPSMSRITNYRDPLHGKIVYQADPLTLYRAAPAWQDVPRCNAGGLGGSASAGLPAQGLASGGG